MTQREGDREAAAGETTWGPRLFYGVLAAALVFFWWLLVYAHGAGGSSAG